MPQKLDYLKESPSQTAGPYVHIGCTPNAAGIGGVYSEDLGSTLFTGDAAGERLRIRGSVFDGEGTPLKDTLVEIWRADANGLYISPEEIRGSADPHFTGWGRSSGDATTGEFIFDTIKPGRVPFVDGRLQAPHITFWIVARGINVGLQTRMYFADETAANAEDPVLTRLEHPSRLPTLMGVADSTGEYRFDIRLQGENETVFFDM